MKPILFSTPMIQAILAGNKTQTRRIVKSRTGLFSVDTAKFEPDMVGFYYNRSVQEIDDDERSTGKTIFCPYGEVGDILWVRETFQKVELSDECDYEGYIYKADKNSIEWVMSNDEWKWNPSIFMPKEACRLFLEVTDVRVERLNKISENDAVNEGVETLGFYPGYDVSSRGKFEGLWGQINGIQSWEENPFVWVITFEKTTKPDNF